MWEQTSLNKLRIVERSVVMDTLKPKKVQTLCIFRKGDQVLLGLKKRGFGQGLWNGFGGKVEPGEEIEAAALREVQEEVGLVPEFVTPMGIAVFDFADGSVQREVHIYVSTQFSGEPQESEEMRPQWFTENALPFDHMWPADKHWFPFLLESRKFHLRCLFDHPSTIDRMGAILESEIHELESFEGVQELRRLR